jgi:hypothetical protein
MKKPKIENSEKLNLLRSLLHGAFTLQQTEAVIGMLKQLSEAVGAAQVGDRVQINATVRKDKRLKIELDDVASEEKSHFNKIVLGACRKAHIACLRSQAKFDFKKVEQVLYRILFAKTEEETEKVKRMKRIAYGIYRSYSRKIRMARTSNASSSVFLELQETFPKIDMQAIVELFAASLEGKQFRMSKDNALFIEDMLWMLQGKIPNQARKELE